MITAATPIVAASEKKRLANRTNARRSTGPKTAAGKARSSQNALKFGIFCRDLLVPGEDPEVLNVFKRDMIRCLNPRNDLELQLAEQIIADEWRIKRVRAAEHAAFERLHAEDCQRVEQNRTQRRMDSMAELRAYQTKFAVEIQENRTPPHVVQIMADTTERLARIDAIRLPEPNAGAALDRLMHDSPELERLGKYEQRLRSSTHRCYKELRQLRSADPEEMSAFTAELLGESAPPEPEEAIKKNEATDDASGESKTSCDSGSEESSDSSPRSITDLTGRDMSNRPATEPDRPLCAA